MSTRVGHSVLRVTLGLLMLMPATVIAEEPPPEEEADIKTMVQQVKKLVDAQKEKATGDAPFPFGHYIASAPPPVVKASTKTEEKKPTGPVGLPEFNITGKMKMGRQMKLFIGRGAYGVGETYDGAKIVEIKDDEAVFEYSGQRYTKSIP